MQKGYFLMRAPLARFSLAGWGMKKRRFYIVRKGDIIGVYRSLSDFHEQGGGMSVYKGYGWPQGAQDLISSFGLKNPLFSVNASHINDDHVFGKLIPCPLQEPSSSSSSQSHGGTFSNPSLPKRLRGMASDEPPGLLSSSPPHKHLKIENSMVPLVVPSNHDSCTIEFDGASKGNPGKAGAGAVLRASHDNSVLFYLREGVGIASNNVAEYRALILGLNSALQKGFRNVRVQGDSMLVCKQVQDEWKTRHPKMAELCKQAKELKKLFKSFHIQHIDRKFNSEADTQANHAINLAEGQTKEIAGG